MSGRGRKRRCGPSGGGTLRRKSPQEGQRPSLPMGLVASARSQWPRASHWGLMHCTVKPGRYCIFLPQWPLRLDRFRRDDTAASKINQAPLAAHLLAAHRRKQIRGLKRRG